VEAKSINKIAVVCKTLSFTQSHTYKYIYIMPGFLKIVQLKKANKSVSPKINKRYSAQAVPAANIPARALYGAMM